MQIGSRGRESFEASPQIGLWQQQKQNNLFRCVRHVEILTRSHVRVLFIIVLIGYT